MVVSPNPSLPRTSPKDVSSDPTPATPKASGISRFVNIAREELRGVRPRMLVVNAALATLPNYALGRVRTRILRLAGFEIGHGSSLFGAPHISGEGDIYGRLSIGKQCAINVGFSVDLGADITIGDNVSIGHDVMILTTSHKLGPASHRAGLHHLRPVRIGDGAWICARATILPGVTVGAGAVVSAGSVVNKDVPPNSIVAGSPARVVVPTLR